MADVIPLPYLRARFREAVGVVLSDGEYPEHTHETARRFLRGLTDDTRRVLTADMMTIVGEGDTHA